MIYENFTLYWKTSFLAAARNEPRFAETQLKLQLNVTTRPMTDHVILKTVDHTNDIVPLDRILPFPSNLI